MKMSQQQFDALVRLIEATAELEARKVHCEMTSDDYEWEPTAADDARQEANRLLVREDE